MPSSHFHEILEITFLARAGQGAKTAAQIVAEAALKQDLYFQAFPQYGPERRGAPVKAYVRLSKQPIFLHCQIRNSDITVVIKTDLLEELQEEHREKIPVILLNSQDGVTENLRELADKVYRLDASTIANKFLRKNIPNLAMTGALISVINREFEDLAIDLEAIVRVIKENFSSKWSPEIVDGNISALREGAQQVEQIR